MVSSESAKGSVSTLPPISFWYILVLVLLAPVQLSRHIQEVVSSRKRFKFIFYLVIVQIVLILPSTFLQSYLKNDTALIFTAGAVIGALIIMLLPMIYIDMVKKVTEGKGGIRLENFLRGVSRIWVFFWIGGLMGILIGRPEWTTFDYASSFGLGWATANAMSLMSVMGQIDVLGYEKSRLILTEAHTARKLKPILFGFICLFSIGAHCLPVILGKETSLLYPSLASILIFVFAGMTFGSRYILGWAVGMFASFIARSRTVLRYDELGVIVYSRLNNYLEGLRNNDSLKNYYHEVAYFLPWSPWHEKILTNLEAFLAEDTPDKLGKVDKLLDLPVSELQILVDNLSETKIVKGSSVEGATVAVLKQILDNLESGKYHIDLKFDLNSKMTWSETLRGWFQLMPQNFSSQSAWSDAFEKKVSKIRAESDPELNETARKVINTILERFVKKQAEIYFQPPVEIAPILEKKKETYHLKNQRAEIEVDIVNTAKIPINLNKVIITLTSSQTPLRFITDDDNRQKEWRVKIETSLEAGSAYTITLPIFCDRNKEQVEFALEINYAFHREGGSDAGYHASKIVRRVELLFVKERPFTIIKPNPYTRYPIKTSDRLFGRTNEIDRISAILLANPCEADYVLITGERRLGKTSLLYVIEENLNRSDAAVVYYDAQRFAWERQSEKGNGVIDMLRLLSNAYANKYNLSKSTNIVGIIDFFTNFADRKVVFLVDEFDAYLEQLKPEEMKFWESKPFHETAISFVCSVPESAMRSQSIDWFNNLFGTNSYPVSPLNHKAANELITSPLDDLLDFEPGAVSAILRLTGGFPIYIQAVCGALINYMNSKASTVVTRADIDLCMTEEPESISRLMASYILTIPKRELELLSKLALNNNQLQWGVSDGLAIETVNSMKQRGLIQESGGIVSCTAELLLSLDLLNLRSIE